MKGAGLRERMDADSDWYAKYHLAKCSVEDSELEARIIFPAGNLPDESCPVSFTRRELEIIKLLSYRTGEIEGRILDAHLALNLKSRGMPISLP